jgi:competence protein ComEA
VLPDGRVVLNAATAEDLCRLPGIGPARAAKILELRAKLGGFRSVRQLLRVRGIGPRTLKRLSPLLVLDAPSAPEAKDGG